MLAIKKYKLFTKGEWISLIVIFALLIAVSIPNFAASLRRSRDQNRRDDLGAMVASLRQYRADLDSFPLSSEDGKVMNCLKPGDAPYKNEKGFWVVNPIVCEWGKDAFRNLISENVYLNALPIDPDSGEGASYLYFSDGSRYQIFASMEGMDEAEVDPRIIARNLPCGNRVCNAGRDYGCDVAKTLETCEEEANPLRK